MHPERVLAPPTTFQSHLAGTAVDFGRVADSVGRVLAPDGWGSGVLLDDKGLVATALHVVAPITPGATVEIEIGGRSRAATFLGAVPDKDLAFLRLGDTAGLAPVKWGSAEAGDSFVAIGFPAHPYGRGRMRVDGMITGYDQRLDYSSNGSSWSNRQLGTTSAPLLPGQSGGAVVNAAGELIGISHATMMDMQSASPLAPGFFVPSDQVAAAYRKLAAGAASVEPPVHRPSPARTQLAALPGSSDADAADHPAVAQQQAALPPPSRMPDPAPAVAGPSRDARAAASAPPPSAPAKAGPARAAVEQRAKPAVPQWLQKELADTSRPLSTEAILEWNRLRQAGIRRA